MRHETGRELLVLVGEDTITYNDMLGNSFKVPILPRLLHRRATGELRAVLPYMRGLKVRNSC